MLFLAQSAHNQPLLPMWATGPLAVVLLLALAAHVLWLLHAKMPDSRRRIRLMTGVLMMMGAPLGVYAFSVVTPSTPRNFAIAWLLLGAITLTVLLLAILDIANTWRLHFDEQREVSRNIRAARDAADALRRARTQRDTTKTADE